MLNLSKRELEYIGQQIESDVRGAMPDNNKRIERCNRYFAKWRNLPDAPAPGDEDKPNFSIPVLIWQLRAKWSQMMQAMFGEDAAVVAKPVGPADQQITAKISRFVSWVVFSHMRIVKPIATWTFRVCLYGRAHYYRPWKVRRRDGEVLYEGPDFIPLRPDDLIVPAERVSSIHDFSFVVRRFRVTPQQLLDGERAGAYFGISENWERIVKAAHQAPQRDVSATDGDLMAHTEDRAQGVEPDGSTAHVSALTCWEWYGHWRLPKGDREDSGQQHQTETRNPDQQELMVRYLPDLHMVVTAELLSEIYPKMDRRRPFGEGALIPDGTYWGPGFGELLEDVAAEMTANHNLAQAGHERSVGPIVFYRPGEGFDPKKHKLEPMMAFPVSDPRSVNVMSVQSDMSGSVVMGQALGAIAEKVTAVSDQTLGRAIDRPNAPQTAAGQMMLIEQGNVQVWFDATMLREDLGVLLFDLFQLYQNFSDGDLFFRVTEEEAGGLFEANRGGSTITPEERGGRYDFELRFATSVWAKQVKKQETLELYGIAMQNPIVAQSPRALWVLLNKAFKAMGDDNLSAIIPEPPDLGLPKQPREEWTLMLQGEDVQVNPNDNDDLHLQMHRRFRELELKKERPDMDAVDRSIEHEIAHESAKRQKMLMQAMTAKLVDGIAAATADPSMGGLHARGPIPMPVQQLSQEIQGAFGGGQGGGNGPAA